MTDSPAMLVDPYFATRHHSWGRSADFLFPCLASTTLCLISADPSA